MRHACYKPPSVYLKKKEIKKIMEYLSYIYGGSLHVV